MQCKDVDYVKMAQHMVQWWTLVNIMHLPDQWSNHYLLQNDSVARILL
jgi:hypothetical protein